MAIVSISENWSGRSAEGSREIIHGEAERVTVREWAVETDNPADDSTLVEGPAGVTAGLPDYGYGHPDDQWLLVTRKEARPRGPTLWNVTVTYIRMYAANPLNEELIQSFGAIQTSEDVDTDAFGTPITNVNGETYDPPLQREFTDLVFQVERNEYPFNWILAMTFADVVNVAPWNGIAPGLVLCRMPVAQYMWHPTQPYYRVRYEFHIRGTGWRRRVLHAGYRVQKLLAGGGKKTTSKGLPWLEMAIDADGKPVTQPVLLDSRGAQLFPNPGGGGYIDENGVAQTINWREYQLYPFADFTPLNLG